MQTQRQAITVTELVNSCENKLPRCGQEKAALIADVPHQVGTLKSGISIAAFSVLREAPFAASRNEVRLYTFLRLLPGNTLLNSLIDIFGQTSTLI
jgi:hypothetical protein